MPRRLLLFLVVALLSVLAAGVAINLWAGRRVASEVARLEKKYGGLDGQSLAAPRVSPEDNRARFARAAAALTVQGNTAYSTLLASLTTFESASQSPVPEDVRTFIGVNQEAMRVADEARRVHLASWDADYAGGANVPSWLSVRTLANVLFFAARLDIKAGRPEEAGRTIATGLAVGASLTNEPSLIAQLIRIGITTQQCEALERLIAESTPSRAALEELAGLLVETRKTDPMRVGLRAELSATNAMLERMERGDRIRAEDLPVGPFSRGAFGRLGRPLVRLTRVQYLRDMEMLIDAQAGPRPRPTFETTSRRRLTDPLGLSASGVRGLERAIDSGDMFNSVLDVTQIGVALRRHQLDRGSYPDDLAALAPAYLPRLPAKPPAYARTGAGFTLKGEAVRTSGPVAAALDWEVSR